MRHIKRSELPTLQLKGRMVSNPVDPKWPEMDPQTFGAFALFSYKYDVMETHFHQTEYMYVIEAKDAYVSYGDDYENMTKEPLYSGEIIRPVDDEWHRFDFENDGYVDFINFFVELPPRTIELPDWKKEQGIE